MNDHEVKRIVNRWIDVTDGYLGDYSLSHSRLTSRWGTATSPAWYESSSLCSGRDLDHPWRAAKAILQELFNRGSDGDIRWSDVDQGAEAPPTSEVTTHRDGLTHPTGGRHPTG